MSPFTGERFMMRLSRKVRRSETPPNLPPPVLSKSDFARRYRLGEFGNASPTWNTLEEFLRARRAGHELVHIRNRVAGASTWYNVPTHQVEERASRIVRKGEAVWENLYYSLMCPTEKTTVQGEVLESSLGRLQLYYSDIAKPMRQSLIEGGRQVGHVAAEAILRRYLNPRSWDWMRWLLSAYPGHVIEFTALSRCWGSLPGHNTLFWEVRRY